MPFLRAALVALALAAPAHAEIYRWIDPETGSVKFSNQPPERPGMKYEILRFEAQPPPKLPPEKPAAKPPPPKPPAPGAEAAAEPAAAGPPPKLPPPETQERVRRLIEGAQ